MKMNNYRTGQKKQQNEKKTESFKFALLACWLREGLKEGCLNGDYYSRKSLTTLLTHSLPPAPIAVYFQNITVYFILTDSPVWERIYTILMASLIIQSMWVVLDE